MCQGRELRSRQLKILFFCVVALGEVGDKRCNRPLQWGKVCSIKKDLKYDKRLKMWHLPLLARLLEASQGRKDLHPRLGRTNKSIKAARLVVSPLGGFVN